MVRRLEDVNEGATTPRGKPPCKAIKGRVSIIDKTGIARAAELTVFEGGEREGYEKSEEIRDRPPGNTRKRYKKQSREHKVLLRGTKEKEKGQKQQRCPDAPVNNVM
jgi:hypothetical protein